MFRSEKDPEATSIFFTDPDGSFVYSSATIDATPYSVRLSPVWPYTRLALLALSALLMASAFLFAIVWLVRLLLGKMKGVQHLSVRTVPRLASLTFLGILYLASGLFDGLGQKTPSAFLLCAASILFPLLAAIGLLLALRVPTSEISRGVRIHSLLVSAACCTMALFLLSWHLVGFRAWAP